MGENLVHDRVARRQVIALGRGRRGGKADDVGRAIREATLRDPCQLLVESKTIQLLAGGGEDPELFTRFLEVEFDMVIANTAIGEELDEGIGAGPDKGERLDGRLCFVGKI